MGFGIGSIVSSVFGGGGGSGSGGEPIQPRKDIPYKSAEKLYDYANDYSGKYQYDPAKPYSGNLSATRNQNQNKSQDILSDYLNRPLMNESFASAKSNVTDTLNGGYDPRTSPYYAAMKDQIMRDQSEAYDAIKHRSAVSGMLHSDPRRIQERKLVENTSGQLANLLGSIYENERNRQMQATPYAIELGRLEENIPITRATAGEQIGGQAQQYEQGVLDRLYNEFLRQTEGAREPLNIYEGLSSRNYNDYPAQPLYQSQGAGASQLGGLLGSLGGLF